MKNVFWCMLLTCTLWGFSCQKGSNLEPQTKIACTIDYTNHPKDLAYKDLLNRYTQNGFVGITLLVDNPKDSLWIGASGYADIENNVKMTPCHVNYAASLNKTYIAVMLLQMEEEGKLSLDDKINTYIPKYIADKLPNGNDATIKHLLQCRSGMQDAYEMDFMLDFLNNPTKSYSMETLLEKYIYKTKPLAAPGEKFYYGDANFIVLSMIIEQLEGSMADAYQHRIFERLGVQSTYFVDNPAQMPEGMVANYWDRFGTGVLENVSDYQMATTTGLGGTGGLIGTVYDFNLFMRGLMDGTLINADSYAKLTNFVEIATEDAKVPLYVAYSLGFAIISVTGTIWYGSFGDHVGASAMMLYNPEHDVIITVTQNKGSLLNDKVKEDFFGYFLAELEQIAFF